jgi:hypothetical protein
VLASPSVVLVVFVIFQLPYLYPVRERRGGGERKKKRTTQQEDKRVSE